jgi:hypothetical protein
MIDLISHLVRLKVSSLSPPSPERNEAAEGIPKYNTYAIKSNFRLNSLPKPSNIPRSVSANPAVDVIIGSHDVFSTSFNFFHA